MLPRPAGRGLGRRSAALSRWRRQERRAPHLSCDVGEPVAYGQHTARRPLAVYRRKRRRASPGLAPHCARRDGCVLGLHWSQGRPQETTGSPWTIFRGRRPTPPSLQLSCSVFSQCFGFLHVGGVTPLGEPAVDHYRLYASSVRGVTRGRLCRHR